MCLEFAGGGPRRNGPPQAASSWQQRHREKGTIDRVTEDGTAAPAPSAGASAPQTPVVLGPLLRRIRRSADLSQRELAHALGVSCSAVAQAETGTRDLPVTLLARAARLAGLRLALLAASGREAPEMVAGAVRDRAGRHFPAHLDTRYGDEGWWHGNERYSRQRPWYTFDRQRGRRDADRTANGTPPDHQVPRPGDSPEERRQARRARALVARAVRAQQETQARSQLGPTGGPVLTCTCPPDCDDLLFAS